MVENSQYRQTITTLERENDEMKAALRTVVENCVKFVGGERHFVAHESSHLNETATISNASSALLSEEIDSRRTSIFSNIEDSNGTINATPFSEINESEMPPPEPTTGTHDMSEDQSGEEFSDSEDDQTFALNLRKSMAVVGKTKMSRKTMRKTMQKGVSRQSNVKPQSRRTSRRLSQQTENENDENSDDISINEPTLNPSDCSINITQRKSKLRRSTRHRLEPNVTRNTENSTIEEDLSIDQSTVLADISSPVVQKVRKKRGRKTKTQLEGKLISSIYICYKRDVL